MKKLKTLLLASILCISTAIFGACSCNEEPPPEVDLDYNKNGIIEEWEEEFTSMDRPTNRADILENATTISTLTELKAINDNYETTTTVYMLTNDIDCEDEIMHISLRNNVLVGNNYVIKNFMLARPNGGDTISLIDGQESAKVYDLRVYGKLQNIPVDATNSTLSTNNATMFYNIHTLDNVTTKASFDISHVRQEGNTTNYNVSATIMAMNCRYINNCTAIGLINYNETAGYSTGVKKFAGIDLTNGTSSDFNYHIKNSTSKVTMNVYSESTTQIGGITCESYGTLYGNTVDSTANINYSTYDTVAESESYKTKATIGGICLSTNKLATIRYNKFNGNIKASSTLKDGDSPQTNVTICGLANNINGSTCTFNEIRGKIDVTNIKNVDVAGFSNKSTNTLYYYNICTTDITIDNTFSAKTSQFSTNLEYGLVDYLLMDSDVYVNIPYTDAKIYTALFSLMNTSTEGIETKLPNLHKIVVMGHMSFRMPSENNYLYFKNGLCADSTNYSPMLYSNTKVYYTENRFSLKRITPSNTGTDVNQDLLDEATSNFAESYIMDIPVEMLNHSWLFGNSFGMNSTYIEVIDNTKNYEPDNFRFANITDSEYFSERTNLNIFNNVRFDYYLNGEYTSNIEDEFYCILASKIKSVEDSSTGEIFTIGLDSEYINYIKTKFETENTVEAIVSTIEDMTKKTDQRDTQLISCTTFIVNDIVNGNGDVIGQEIKIIGEKTTTIKIDTHMIENGVNYISVVISKSNNM